jgi:hypothetical protein
MQEVVEEELVIMVELPELVVQVVEELAVLQVAPMAATTALRELPIEAVVEVVLDLILPVALVVQV